jgi:hypothetical protein
MFLFRKDPSLILYRRSIKVSFKPSLTLSKKDVLIVDPLTDLIVVLKQGEDFSPYDTVLGYHLIDHSYHLSHNMSIYTYKDSNKYALMKRIHMGCCLFLFSRPKVVSKAISFKIHDFRSGKSSHNDVVIPSNDPCAHHNMVVYPIFSSGIVLMTCPRVKISVYDVTWIHDPTPRFMMHNQHIINMLASPYIYILSNQDVLILTPRGGLFLCPKSLEYQCQRSDVMIYMRMGTCEPNWNAKDQILLMVCAGPPRVSITGVLIRNNLTGSFMLSQEEKERFARRLPISFMPNLPINQWIYRRTFVSVAAGGRNLFYFNLEKEKARLDSVIMYLAELER